MGEGGGQRPHVEECEEDGGNLLKEGGANKTKGFDARRHGSALASACLR